MTEGKTDDELKSEEATLMMIREDVFRALN
jgi:hypothetical protein